MIQAEKIVGRDGRDWIKIEFRPNPLYNELLSELGAIYVPHAKAWALPFSKREDFEKKLGDYLIVWKDEEVDGHGGIKEEDIPDKPVIPGYDVTYDEEGNIIDSVGFKTKPWGDFQVRGFNALVTRDFLILADEAGLGKSWQVATAIEARKRMGQLNRGLIICKASLLYNWRDEIQKHTNEKSVIAIGTPSQRYKLYAELMNRDDWTFLIISYETFRTDLANIQVINNTLPLDFCVLDEAHKVKNPMSKLGMSIHAIPSFKYRYVLTATPLPNTPLESYNYLRFGRTVDIDWFNFQHRYAILDRKNTIIGYQNILELKSLIQANMLRRRKKDKLKNLPEFVIKVLPIEMTPLQKRIYRSVMFEVLGELREETGIKRVPNALAKLMRLQQVTDSLDLVGAEPSPQNSAKFIALDELLEDLIDEGGNKVIVFSRFRAVIELLRERYQRYNPAVIHGDVSSQGRSVQLALRMISRDYDLSQLTEEEKEKLIRKYTSSDRQNEVYKFQEDPSCKLFLGCTPACREGLTLTAAMYVVFLDWEWTWDYVYQAISRAHRIGQKNCVTAYLLQCVGTIDEKVYEIVMRKKALSEQMIDSGITLYNEEDDIREIVESLKTA